MTQFPGQPLRFFFLALATLPALAAPASAAGKLASTSWTSSGGAAPRILFRPDGEVTGNASCNIFFGSYTTEGDRIAFKGFGTTRKMCGLAVMRAERKFLEDLKASKTYQISGGKLMLRDAAGAVIVSLNVK